jgi:hypothetical protein
MIGRNISSARFLRENGIEIPAKEKAVKAKSDDKAEVKKKK